MNQDNNMYQPPTPPPQADGDTAVMSTKEWVVTYLIMMIPCVGLIMAFVWGFGGSGNLNRRNYCRAFLIVIGILIALYLLLWIILGAALFSILTAF